LFIQIELVKQDIQYLKQFQHIKRIYDNQNSIKEEHRRAQETIQDKSNLKEDIFDSQEQTCIKTEVKIEDNNIQSEILERKILEEKIIELGKELDKMIEVIYYNHKIEDYEKADILQKEIENYKTITYDDVDN
jgi:hypothetical protein